MGDEENCRAMIVADDADLFGHAESAEEGQPDNAEQEVCPDSEIDDGGSWTLWMAILIVLTMCFVWLFSCLHPFLKLIFETEKGSLSNTIALFIFGILSTLILACFVFVVVGYFHLPRIVRYSRKKYEKRQQKLASLLSRRYIKRIQDEKAAVYESLIGKDAASELKKLRTMSAEIDPCAWLKQFEAYQSTLDKQADREISKFSTRIGATAAISQTRLTDMIAVVVLSAMMLLKLAQLYNQRVSTFGAVRLALRWGTNVYVAGEAQSVTGKIAKGIGKFVGVVATAGGSFIGQPTIGASAAKAIDMTSNAIGLGAEFAVNKILAKKLGAFAHKQLHALTD